MGNVGLAILQPWLHHGVGILARESFNGRRCSAVGISFTKNGIDGAAQYRTVALFNLHFFFIFRFIRILRHIVALVTQFFDGLFQLRQRCTYIGKLDDISLRRTNQFTQFGQIVRYPLFFLQIFRKSSQNPSCQ